MRTKLIAASRVAANQRSESLACTATVPIVTNASGAMCWPMTCSVPNGRRRWAMVVCDHGPSPRNDRDIDVRRLPPTRLAAGCHTSNPSRAQVASSAAGAGSAVGGATRARLRRGCHAARSIVQNRIPSTEATDPTPMLVNAGLRMLARWPGLFIQASTTSAAVCWPAATFSPHVRHR